MLKSFLLLSLLWTSTAEENIMVTGPVISYILCKRKAKPPSTCKPMLKTITSKPLTVVVIASKSFAILLLLINHFNAISITADLPGL